MFDLNVVMSFLQALGPLVGWTTVVRLVFAVIRFVWKKWFQRPAPLPTVVILIPLVKTIVDGGVHPKGAKNKRRKARRRRQFRP